MSDKELFYKCNQETNAISRFLTATGNGITISVSDRAEDCISPGELNWHFKEIYPGSIFARKDHAMPNVEKVIFNPPATVVIWNDGTKTVVKAKESGRKKSDKDTFSEEYGLAMAIAKRYFGSRSAFLKAVKNAKRPGVE